MRNINMDTIGKFAKGVCNILVSGAILVLSCKALNMNVEQHETGYYDAVEVIMNNRSMFSSSKKELIGLLKRDETSEYYKTVISIVESNSFSSEKVEMIKLLNQ